MSTVDPNATEFEGQDCADCFKPFDELDALDRCEDCAETAYENDKTERCDCCGEIFPSGTFAESDGCAEREECEDCHAHNNVQRARQEREGDEWAEVDYRLDQWKDEGRR